MSIDPNDAPKGYVAAPTNQSGWPECSRCSFTHNTCPVRHGALRCVPYNRADNQYVIFIEEEERVD